MRTYVLTHGDMKVTIELPGELPEGVAITADVDLKAPTPELAREVIEAFGGPSAFENPAAHGREFGGTAWLRPKAYASLAPIEVTIAVPTGTGEQAKPLPPLIAELRAEQVRAEAAANIEADAAAREARKGTVQA